MRCSHMPSVRSAAEFVRATGDVPWLARIVVLGTLIICLAPMPGVEGKGVSAGVRAVQLEGKLVLMDTHVKEFWHLMVSEDVTYKLPGQPLDALQMAIAPGSFISLDCLEVPNASSETCSKVTNAMITKAAAPVVSANVAMRTLVMVMSLTAGSCNARGAATLSDVRSAFTAQGGYEDYFNDCSYGKMVFDTVTVISTPVPCTSAIMACDYSRIATAASDSAKATLGISDFASYTHYSFVLPLNMVSECGWVGLAELPGARSWYTADDDGIFCKGTVMQEIIHNYGLYHGWKNGEEYADNSTAMGLGNGCPSAPELWRLGWATVLARLDKDNFPAKVFRQYTLPATYLGPEKAMIKIQPDWLGSSYKKNVYLALRVNSGGDRDLQETFSQVLNIHELNKNIDNQFLASGDPKVTIIKILAAGQSVTFAQYKLVVRAASLQESGTKMVVKVCRYLKQANECK